MGFAEQGQARISQPMQGELFKAETGWFHVFRSFVDSGALGKMDGATVKVYLVIKTHTNIETGIAGPIAHKTIAFKSGVHESSVKRAINELESLGYLSKSACGRSYVYRFNERWRIHDSEGNHTADASWPYVPVQVKPTADDLRISLQAGRVPTTVHIERLQLNFTQAASGAVVMNVQELKDPALRNALASIGASLASR